MVERSRFAWLPTAFAAVAFVAITVVFALELGAFRTALIDGARRDLGSRTAIAVSTLSEPLRTGDFAAVHEFSRKCAADGVRLSVFGMPKGGLVFDSLGGFTDARRDGRYIYGTVADAGAFGVRLGLSRDRVLAPFDRARFSVALAGLVGVAGVFLFFFVTYRQRVRIRELRRLEDFRRTFIADVSHEIKTPLTGILCAADMLDGDDRLVAMIKRESRRMNRLVGQILGLARLERDGDVLQREEVDLDGLLAEVAARHGVEFSAPSVAGRTFFCDARLVEEAVENLVVNAKRHSGADRIAVSCEGDAHRVKIVVEDDGKGVPAGHAGRIFERFYRVDPARAAETGGSGLGLAIVRRIARLHGGDAVHEPVRPHGARFVVTLRR